LAILRRQKTLSDDGLNALVDSSMVINFSIKNDTVIFSSQNQFFFICQFDSIILMMKLVRHFPNLITEGGKSFFEKKIEL